MKRCKWVDETNELYVKYHDTEWGVPSYDDHYLFEMLLLESFQAGLSWITILKKREAFREAFDDFDVIKVSQYDETKILSLMSNQKIVRNQLKIRAAVNNAKIFIQIQQEFGSFSNYIWSFTDGKIIYNENDELPTTSSLSDQISADLKKRGMKFVGSTIIYSYLQAMGIINDHETTCDFYKRSKVF
ncbi:DNA-3-methyladenine glycosylase I [Traorella massiliensis]|uniref:DNA-3-methyladenine glycosylase I n=1 Tax=Traorella massiliensis TaxID=1903263 RepID=UPI002355CC89|nr:DNA-3-methyladenine glycosylase I [Traorella massiliensis]